MVLSSDSIRESVQRCLPPAQWLVGLADREGLLEGSLAAWPTAISLALRLDDTIIDGTATAHYHDELTKPLSHRLAATDTLWQAGMSRDTLYDAFACRDWCRKVSANLNSPPNYPHSSICGRCIAHCPRGKKARARQG